MAAQAIEFVEKGVCMIKVKLGKAPKEDVERIRQIRTAIGPDIKIRIDANQGWAKEDALEVLTQLALSN